MQFKNATAIVHAMAGGMCGMHELYVCYLNTDVGCTLKYSVLLPARTQRTCDNSFILTGLSAYVLQCFIQKFLQEGA